MKKIFNHIKRWNKWRKFNRNSHLYKVLVLFGIIKSATFYHVWTDEECGQFYKGFMEGLHAESDQNTH